MKMRVKIRTWYGQMEDEIGLLIPYPDVPRMAVLTDRQMRKVNRAISKVHYNGVGMDMIRRRWQIQFEPPCGAWHDAILEDNTIIWS